MRKYLFQVEWLSLDLGVVSRGKIGLVRSAVADHQLRLRAVALLLEDEILELFERVDTAQTRMSEIETETESAQTQHQQSVAEVEAAEPGLNQDREKLEQAISEAESILSQDVAERYQRLVRAHGPGAMAKVIEGSCTSCSIRLSQQLVVELSLGQIISCNNCGRLLYLAEESDE